MEGTDGTNVTSATVSNLEAGSYTVVVTDTEIGCTATQKTIQVPDGVTALAPTASISANPADGAPRNIPGACAAETGYIIADITLNDPTQTLTYQWYEGSLDYASDLSAGTPIANGVAINLGASNPQITTPSATETRLFNITAGMYTLAMTDTHTGCRYLETYDVAFQRPANNNYTCNPTRGILP